jgi:SAM-dependent methyltransferase
VSVLHRLLAHPATRGRDLDSPETTAIRRQIVRSKPFLRAIYEEWYRMLMDRVPDKPGQVLELGSGGGFFGEAMPDLITSELFPVPGVDQVIDAQAMPFEDASLTAIVMTNVFHHIPRVELFLSEAARTLVPGGRVAMVEPWNTPWSRVVHRTLHHEPMVPDAEEWTFPSSGPLSSANAALPWIVCERDRDRLESQWPLEVVEISRFMPLRYLLSGGVSMRSLQPGWTYGFWRSFERITGYERRMAMFALIVIERES